MLVAWGLNNAPEIEHNVHTSFSEGESWRCSGKEENVGKISWKRTGRLMLCKAGELTSRS